MRFVVEAKRQGKICMSLLSSSPQIFGNNVQKIPDI
jgi:hypothetical protein